MQSDHFNSEFFKFWSIIIRIARFKFYARGIPIDLLLSHSFILSVVKLFHFVYSIQVTCSRNNEDKVVYIIAYVYDNVSNII